MQIWGLGTVRRVFWTSVLDKRRITENTKVSFLVFQGLYIDVDFRLFGSTSQSKAVTKAERASLDPQIKTTPPDHPGSPSCHTSFDALQALQAILY